MNIYVAIGISLFILPFVLTNEYTIIKKLGDITFFEKHWKYTNDLNLKEYVENAIVLQNVTDRLSKICEHLERDTNCKYFEQNIKNSAISAQKKIDEITRYKRRKRAFWFIFIGTAITQVLVACGVIAATKAYTDKELEETREIQKKDREMLEDLMQINHMRNNLTIVLMKKLEQLEKYGRSGDSLNELLNIATQSLNYHDRLTQRYIDILNNNFKQHFFEINEYDTFEKTISDINSLLRPHAQLPSLDPYEILDLSDLSYSNNNTHISIHTKIPILYEKNTHTLYEFIPIPFKEGETVQILNTNAKLFFNDNNNKTRVMLPQTLRHCKQLSTLSICDSILHESLFDMDDCMSAIVSNQTMPPQCKFKPMEYRNYFIRLSPHRVFCFIVSPIQFRIVCNDQEKIHKLTENSIVHIPNQCDLHKLLNDFQNNENTLSSFETNEIFLKPNFSIFDEQLNNWTDVQFINKLNITITTLKNMTDKLENDLHTNHTNTTSTFNFNFLTETWTLVGSFFSNLQSNLYLAICIFIFVPIFILILIFFICINCTKK